MRRVSDAPDSVVAARVRDPGGVPVFRDVTVNLLHEQVRYQHPVHEVAPYVPVIEVVLE